MKTTLVEGWLDDCIRSEGLGDGLRQLSAWTRDLSPIERELVRSIAFDVVYDHVGLPSWCPTYGERRETTRRLVNAVLDG